MAITVRSLISDNEETFVLVGKETSASILVYVDPEGGDGDTYLLLVRDGSIRLLVPNERATLRPGYYGKGLDCFTEEATDDGVLYADLYPNDVVVYSVSYQVAGAKVTTDYRFAPLED